MHISRMRPFLKWPGNKFRITQQIAEILPEGNKLIEPFIGAGAIFLNTNFKHYLLSDNNPDLIHLYKTLQERGKQYIDDARALFIPKHNCEKFYYKQRKLFNESQDPYQKAIIFLYLNRHGYNGLVRYNSKGIYNVPFGHYKKPYFPEDEIAYFYEKSKKAKFVCQDFRTTMQQAKHNNVIYCDPPYVPLSHSANFTRYSQKEFTLEDQEDLAQLAKSLAENGIKTLLSNHDTPFTQKIYKGAKHNFIQVARSISCQASSRRPVREILALYG